MLVLTLFGHIVGVLILFAAFALEWVALRQLRGSVVRDGAIPGVELTRLLPQLHRTAGILLILTGGYMASTMGVWSFGWIRVSLAALVVLAIAGTVSVARLRSHPDGPWLTTSFRTRVSSTLAIVYLMVAKPDVMPSLTIVVLAAVAGAASTLTMPRTAAPPARSDAELR